jgi:multiple sugar transport system permease protein
MSVTQQAVAIGRRLRRARPRRRPWFGGIHGADYVWAFAFAVPYVVIFLAFVVYPICYGLWLGSDPALYVQLFDDPRYFTAVINTLIYVGVGVNLKMFLAFLLSGFFMRKRWWVKALLVVFILPWATPALPAYMSIHWLLNGQWGMLNNILWLLFGYRRPGLSQLALDGAAGEYRSLYLEEPAVLDDHPAGRKNVDPAGTL